MIISILCNLASHNSLLWDIYNFTKLGPKFQYAGESTTLVMLAELVWCIYSCFSSYLLTIQASLILNLSQQTRMSQYFIFCESSSTTMVCLLSIHPFLSTLLFWVMFIKVEFLIQHNTFSSRVHRPDLIDRNAMHSHFRRGRSQFAICPSCQAINNIQFVLFLQFFHSFKQQSLPCPISYIATYHQHFIKIGNNQALN